MIKLLTVLIVLAFNVQNSQKCCIKMSHIRDLVVQEQAIQTIAARIPLPAAINRKQGKNKVFHFIAPKMESLIGRIDQWEYGRI